MTNAFSGGIPPSVRPPQSLCGMPCDTPVLLAFSGGADSSALLHVLLRQRQTHGFPVILAHLEHGIRGVEAQRDLAFCREVATRFGVELIVEHADVPGLAKERGQSLEEAARDARYAFFAKCMRERQIPILVTAHHATDNLETVLFRLSRGTSPSGLGGILPVRPFENGWLVRPLLSLSKREILDYCKRHGISYVADSTNEDTIYARNRIRHEVLPTLSELYPDLESRTSRLCRELCEDEEYLLERSRELLLRAKTETGLRIDVLCDAARPVRRRAISLWASETVGSILQVHTEALLSLCEGGSTNAEVALPGALVGRAESGILTVGKKPECVTVTGEIPFSIGNVPFFDTGFSLLAQYLTDERKIHNLSTVPYIILNGEFDIIMKGAYWRERREGDVILRGGMHRKLRKLQNEAKIPPRIRRTLPVLCDGEGVLWAPLVGVRDGVPVKRAQSAAAGDLWIALVSENT